MREEKKRFMKIDGINYKYLRGKRKELVERIIEKGFYRSWKDLYHCPSEEKQGVKDFRDGVLDFVYGYTGNKHIFDIYGEKNGHKVLITKSHNYIMD